MADPIDLKLVLSDDDYFDIDWTDDGDFEMTDTYETSLFMSIFCERRAKDYEVAVPQYRRGWIGNLLYGDGSEDGSGVWLYDQSRLVQRTVNGVRDEVEKGLMWFIEEEIAEQIDVSSSVSNGKTLVSILITSDNQEILNTKITV